MGEGEVIYSDIQEQPHHNKILQRHLEDLQVRFDNLQSRFEELQYHLDNPNRRFFNQRRGKVAFQQQEIPKDQSKSRTKQESDDTRLEPAKSKRGWFKVEGCCREASKFGIHYVWIDTCCIDKESSTELSEAINSMFEWYKDSKMCFALLSDVPDIDDAFGMRNPRHHSKWFDRGWTLQELIAPDELLFYQRDWWLLGQRSEFAKNIENITNVPHNILVKSALGIESFSAARKLSWAANRQTSRPEDRAYSLMGLFAVNMPIIYGEGEQAAFLRLQREIFGRSGDHSIFTWTCSPRVVAEYVGEEQPDSNWGLLDSGPHPWFNKYKISVAGIFAPSPKFFSRGGGETSIIKTRSYNLPSLNLNESTDVNPHRTYSAFTHATRVQILLEKVATEPWMRTTAVLAHLACSIGNSEDVIGIYLKPTHDGQYERLDAGKLVRIQKKYHQAAKLNLEDVYIGNSQSKSEAIRILSRTIADIRTFTDLPTRKSQEIIIKKLYNIWLDDEGFKLSGLTIGDSTIELDRIANLQKLKYAAVFQSQTTTQFGVVLSVPRYPSMKCRASVRVVPDLDPDTTATQLAAMDTGLKYCRDILHGDRHMIVATAGSGRCIIINFIQDFLGDTLAEVLNQGGLQRKVYERAILKHREWLCEIGQVHGPGSNLFDPERVYYTDFVGPSAGKPFKYTQQPRGI